MKILIVIAALSMPMAAHAVKIVGNGVGDCKNSAPNRGESAQKHGCGDPFLEDELERPGRPTPHMGRESLVCTYAERSFSCVRRVLE